MLFPLIFGILSQSQGGKFKYSSILSLPTARKTSDTTAIIGITVDLSTYGE